MPYATLDIDGAIATIRMQDPARRNVLSLPMLADLTAAFDRLPASVRAVILRAGSDDPVWCAGFDILALRPDHDPLAPDGPLQGLFRRVRDCHAPVIGMIHGSAWGGGTDLALRCDLLVGDQSASFAYTPARLGLPYDEDGLRHAMLRAGPALALEMFATAEPVDADRAWRAGLLNHLVANTALADRTYALAERIATNAPLTVTSAKMHLRALSDRTPLDADIRRRLDESRRRALSSNDYAEGLAAFRRKSPARFTGA